MITTIFIFNHLIQSYILDNQTSPSVLLSDYQRLCHYILIRPKCAKIELNPFYPVTIIDKMNTIGGYHMQCFKN